MKISEGNGGCYPIGSMYAIYGNMDPINIPQMLAYIPYMDPMGMGKSAVTGIFVIGKINHKMEAAIGIIHGGFIGKINYLYVYIYTNRDLG